MTKKDKEENKIFKSLISVGKIKYNNLIFCNVF